MYAFLTWNTDDPLVPSCEAANCDWQTLFQLFSNLLQFAVYLAAFLGAIGIAWAGYLFIRHSANPAKREEAKNTLWKVLVGFGAVLVAALLIQTIIDFLIEPGYLNQVNELNQSL